MIKKVSIAVLNLLLFVYAFSQASNEDETGLRANGKIYVVLAVVTTILVGLIFYLIRIDRKVTRMENKSNKNQHLDT